MPDQVEPVSGPMPKDSPQAKRRGKQKPKKRQPLRTCGARTRHCDCGHHQKEHAGRVGRCWTCGVSCEAFKAKTCISTRVMRNGRCRMHGGKTPEGIASPAWKQGRWATSIKDPKLRTGFYSALSDPSLMRMQQQVALADALLTGLMGSVKSGKAVPVATEVRIVRLMERRTKDIEAVSKMEKHLGLWIHRGDYGRMLDMIVALFRQELITADGKLNIVALQRVQRAIYAGEASLRLGSGEDVTDVDAVEVKGTE